MVNVGVIGHTGRLGKPLVKLLKNHPYAKIKYTESRKKGISGKLSNVELVFLALPEGESKTYLPKLKDKKIIDLSVDHRCSPDWVYGMSELNKDKIAAANYVANPGCLAISVISSLLPLKGKISNVKIASTSGISGAGLQVQNEDNFKVYKEGRLHQHIQEIEQYLGLEKILFVPQRIDVADRGIVSTIFADYDGNDDLECLYNRFYEKSPFVRIKKNIETKNVIKTNFCDMKVLKYDNKIIVISAIDNILYGGSGQAVQNFNIMYGFAETEGLPLDKHISKWRKYLFFMPDSWKKAV